MLAFAAAGFCGCGDGVSSSTRSPTGPSEAGAESLLEAETGLRDAKCAKRTSDEGRDFECSGTYEHTSVSLEGTVAQSEEEIVVTKCDDGTGEGAVCAELEGGKEALRQDGAEDRAAPMECEIEFAGGEAQIRLESSGLTCEGARETFREWRIVREAGDLEKLNFTCTEFPFSAYPLLARCEKGPGHFDIVGSGPLREPPQEAPTETGPIAASPVTFQSPSGNIACRVAATGVRCDIFEKEWEAPKPRPSSCAIDNSWGNSFGLNGRGVRILCTGDPMVAFGAGDSGVRVLDYGKFVRVGEFSCGVKKVGVACVSKTGHTLFLSVQELGAE
jgi:hypothetical protein